MGQRRLRYRQQRLDLQPLTMVDVDTQAIAAAGAAVGAFLGQQVSAIRMRRLIERVFTEKAKPLVTRIEALERAQGWTARTRDLEELPKP